MGHDDVGRGRCALHRFRPWLDRIQYCVFIQYDELDGGPQSGEFHRTRQSRSLRSGRIRHGNVGSGGTRQRRPRRESRQFVVIQQQWRVHWWWNPEYHHLLLLRRRQLVRRTGCRCILYLGNGYRVGRGCVERGDMGRVGHRIHRPADGCVYPRRSSRVFHEWKGVDTDTRTDGDSACADADNDIYT